MEAQNSVTAEILNESHNEPVGPATLAAVMSEVEERVVRGDASSFRPLPTGFDPLDDVLNGGIRPGELLIIGGAFGVGKTIFGLQVARNVVYQHPDHYAIYICYEHDRAHLMSRLLCLESAEQRVRDAALTLRQLGEMALSPDGKGLIARLRATPRYHPMLDAIDTYADRLILVKASGDRSTLDHIRAWTKDVAAQGAQRVLVVVDYLQKIPVAREFLEPEVETTTHLTQGLKELAMSLGVHVMAIAASDRPGLQSKRMRLSHLRGSSALQYEADIGLVFNNKFAIVSREHMVYNPSQAEEMRNWVVVSVEKNRAGRNALDLEFNLDAAHFRMQPVGRFVRERLVDEKLYRE
ncbi:MAG TPA: AAA family ATPase [Chloroflexi bacterium]|jgi:replicative DNA helicase|nr:AAA family ATPase [Chloroflexota bacterium]